MDTDHHVGMIEAFHYDTCGNRRFEYDRFGNLIAERRGTAHKLLTTYEYDCRHRLIKHVSPNGRVSTYTYDAFNRRTSKTVDGKTTEFIWQGSKLIAETDNGQHWRSYIYEADSFRPLAMVVGDASVSDKVKTYWYQNDYLGMPHSLMESLGEVVYRCAYNAYGKVIEEQYHQQERDGFRVDNPLRFQAQYWDEETGLHYNLNRYYDPGIGRYLTQDPIGLAGGDNFYQYCQNPISWIDPLGLVPGMQSTGAGIGTIGNKFEHLELSERHLLDRLSIPKATGNSLFTGTKEQALVDLAEIKSGAAIKNGEFFTTSSGRVWGIHNNSVHPVSGPGVVNVSSHEYKVLAQARKQGKDSAMNTLNHLEKNKIFTPEQVERTKAILNLMKDKK